MVLLRLFQTSRRFNVEIQPQLVLLQKTLLNIEGLGRQLDPDLDLWATASHFLKSGCCRRWGRSVWSRTEGPGPALRQTAARVTQLITAYLRDGGAQSNPVLMELLAEQRRTNRLLQGIIYSSVGFALGLLACKCFCA